MTKKSKFDFSKILKSGRSVDLPEGIHENMYLASVDKGEEKNSLGVENKKHLYIKFNKEGKDGNVEGNFNLSFFKLDPDRDSALFALGKFLKKIKEVAMLYYTEDEFYKKFDPLQSLVDEDEDLEKKDFMYVNIKKTRFVHTSNFSVVEKEAAILAEKLLEKKAGEDGSRLRIRLEKNMKTNYVEIPRYNDFVELMSVTKKDSVLYNAK